METQSLEEDLGFTGQLFQGLEAPLRHFVANQFDLIELMDTEQPPSILPRSARLPAETRGVGRVADRHFLDREQLVAVQIRHRHLSRRDQVQFVPFGVVCLIVELRQLTCGNHRVPVHQVGNTYLVIAMFGGVNIEEIVNESSLQLRTLPFQYRER